MKALEKMSRVCDLLILYCNMTCFTDLRLSKFPYSYLKGVPKWKYLKQCLVLILPPRFFSNSLFFFKSQLMVILLFFLLRRIILVSFLGAVYLVPHTWLIGYQCWFCLWNVPRIQTLLISPLATSLVQIFMQCVCGQSYLTLCNPMEWL